MSGSSVWDELAGRQRAIEDALRQWHARVTADAPPAIAAATGYSLFAGGKRLRPLLCVLACEAAGGAADAALAAACALEMVHTYSLVHDDLPAMDDDDLRRGVPTCHKKYGDALAILAGDALLTGAFAVIADGCPPRTAAVSCAELAAGAGAAGMVGGQVLDLQADGRIEADPAAARGTVAALEDVHRRKTGALFRSSLRLGVVAAQADRPGGVDRQTLAHADAYADAFGLLFQVTDDLLDVEGSAEKAGKAVGKDAARGKLTYPGLLGVADSRRLAADLGRRAVSAAESMGGAGGRLLAGLAGFVVSRDR